MTYALALEYSLHAEEYCVGIPTVGGHGEFHSAYTNNILVNVMTVGIAPVNKIIRSAATRIGDLVGYLGAKTGKDGIHRATMASAAFTDDPESQKPNTNRKEILIP